MSHMDLKLLLISLTICIILADSAIVQMSSRPDSKHVTPTSTDLSANHTPSITNFMDEKEADPGTGDARIDCHYHNGANPTTKNVHEYHFAWAYCDHGDITRRQYYACCSSTIRKPPHYEKTVKGRLAPCFLHICPIGKVCASLLFFGFLFGYSSNTDDIMCVDPLQTRIDQVSATEISHDNKMTFCGEPLQVPDPDVDHTFHQDLSLLLTEEIYWKNGSRYEAPALWIHDSTTGRGFDRTYRVDASVASTAVTLKALHGKIEPRIFNFCSKLASVPVNNLLVFSYAYFVLKHPGRSIPVAAIDAINATEEIPS